MNYDSAKLFTSMMGFILLNNIIFYICTSFFNHKLLIIIYLYFCLKLWFFGILNYIIIIELLKIKSIIIVIIEF